MRIRRNCYGLLSIGIAKLSLKTRSWRASSCIVQVLIPPCFHVEVILADDAFRVAGLNRGFTAGTEFRDEHRNERVPHHVVREAEFLPQRRTPLLKVADHERGFLGRIGAQPGREIRLIPVAMCFWSFRRGAACRRPRASASDAPTVQTQFANGMNRDLARLADFRDLGGNRDEPAFEVYRVARVVWGAPASDGGRIRSRNEQAYRSSDKSICECCHPTALFDAEGTM